jgi:hypothetical protein
MNNQGALPNYLRSAKQLFLGSAFYATIFADTPTEFRSEAVVRRLPSGAIDVEKKPTSREVNYTMPYVTDFELLNGSGTLFPAPLRLLETQDGGPVGAEVVVVPTDILTRSLHIVHGVITKYSRKPVSADQDKGAVWQIDFTVLECQDY